MGTEFRPAAAERLAERWRPYRAYAVQHLWARLTAARGVIQVERLRHRLAPARAGSGLG